MNGDDNMDKKKEKYENCFVVFLDILGFQDKVYRTEKDKKLLDTLIDSLKINQYFTNSNEKKIMNGTEQRKMEIRSYFFSDSFVFMMKENKENLPHLFLIIRYLQDRLWESDLCLRGAITKNKMYWPSSKENIILGPAMISAHKLESKIAIYPRIVVSRELFEYIETEKMNAWPIGDNSKILKDFIKKDIDEIYFFDILNPRICRKKGEKIDANNDCFSIHWNSSMEDNYENIKEKVNGIIKTEIINPDEEIKQKWEWLNSYIEGF